MKSLVRFVAALSLCVAASAALAQDKVVYHFDSGIAQATKGLRNMRNHLDVDPKAKLVAVAHAEGVDFLMEGAKTTSNQEFAALVGDLMGRGVDVRDLRDHAEEPQPEEGAVHPRSVVHAVGRRAHRQPAGTRTVRVHQALTGPAPAAGAGAHRGGSVAATGTPQQKWRRRAPGNPPARAVAGEPSWPSP